MSQPLPSSVVFWTRCVWLNIWVYLHTRPATHLIWSSHMHMNTWSMIYQYRISWSQITMQSLSQYLTIDLVSLRKLYLLQKIQICWPSGTQTWRGTVCSVFCARIHCHRECLSISPCSLSATLDRNAPMKTKLVSERAEVPWINNGVRDARSTRRKAEIKYDVKVA